jgi:hypothetical protein
MCPGSPKATMTQEVLAMFAHHLVGDAVHLLDVRGNGDVRIDELLEGGQLAAIEAKAHRTDFDQLLKNWLEAGGVGVERHKGDIGETWLGMIHEPSRPFPGEFLTRKTAVSIDR